MYGRRYNDQILSFEASGGLREASLVMRDRETDSWWSIISGDAIGGRLEGTQLEELPVWEKVTWGEWRERYPRTRVLSVDGVEHDPINPYMRYFESDGTFRNTMVKDRRLSGKASIYSFRIGESAYAAPHEGLEGGAAFEVEGGTVFLYRKPGAEMFESTDAWFAGGDEGGKGFRSRAESDASLNGFDTFWYIWSNIHDDVVILR